MEYPIATLQLIAPVPGIPQSTESELWHLNYEKGGNVSLVLSLKEGQDFFVGDEQFVVAQIFSGDHFLLRRSADDRIYDIVDQRMTEVMTDVLMSVGNQRHAESVRIAIDAPRNLLVLRGETYRNSLPAATGTGS